MKTMFLNALNFSENKRCTKTFIDPIKIHNSPTHSHVIYIGIYVFEKVGAPIPRQGWNLGRFVREFVQSDTILRQSKSVVEF